MMLDKVHNLTDYVNRLQSMGRVTFTSEEASSALGVSNASFLKSAQRLQKRKLLFNPRRGFYVVVPPQFLSWEAPPPNWYIDALMKHEGQSYYVGLLKAAELHGATHHAVMEFQVVCGKQFPKIRAGRSIIVFYYRKDMVPLLPVIESRKTDTGTMKLASVELTAFDLVRYAHAVGGANAAATALKDLGTKIDGQKLAALAPCFERAVTQRVGYLLDWLGFKDVTQALHERLFIKKGMPWIELEPIRESNSETRDDAVERSERWRVIVRNHPEVDE